MPNFTVSTGIDSLLRSTNIAVIDDHLAMDGTPVATTEDLHDAFLDRQVVTEVLMKADLLTIPDAQAGKLVRVTNIPDVIWELVGTDSTVEANWSGRPETNANGDLVGTIRVRGGTFAEINAIVLEPNEIAAVTDKRVLRIGNGTTPGGIEYYPGILKGVSVITVVSVGTAVENGAALYAADQLAHSMTPYGAAQSLTNPVTILISPGQYDLTAVGSGFVALVGTTSQYINYIGIGSPADTHLYTTSTRKLGLASNRVWKNLSLSIAGATFSDYVLVMNGTFLSVDNCTFDAGAGSAIYVTSFSPPDAQERRFRNCLFKGGQYSVYWLPSGTAVFGIHFEGCRFLAPFGGTTYGAVNSVFTGCHFDTSSNDKPFNNCAIYNSFFRVSGTDKTALFITTGTYANRAEILHSTFVGTGTGKSIDAASAVSYSIGLCALNLGLGSNITNLIASPNNVALP